MQNKAIRKWVMKVCGKTIICCIDTLQQQFIPRHQHQIGTTGVRILEKFVDCFYSRRFRVADMRSEFAIQKILIE